jgi:uncharacterized membrane protein
MPDPAAYRRIARYCRDRLNEARPRADVAAQLRCWAVECDRAAQLHDLEDQARRHRMRAEEYRSVLEQMVSPIARATFQHLAKSDEAIARRLEAAGNQIRRKRRIG